MWHAAGDFPCGCMDELVCRTCNRCKDHCECSPEQQVLDIPFPEQLTIARHEWLALGVAI
jgi:hypothetical protein